MFQTEYINTQLYKWESHNHNSQKFRLYPAYFCNWAIMPTSLKYIAISVWKNPT
jgi:hypothetical protein